MEYVIRIINDKKVQVRYIKINKIHFKTDEVTTSSVNNDNCGSQNIVKIGNVKAIKECLVLRI